MAKLIRHLSPSRLLALASLLCLATGLLESYQILSLNRLNENLANPGVNADSPEQEPRLVFARAFDRQQKGDPLEAIRLYGTLVGQGDRHFRAMVHYNLGTLYLKDAAKLWKDRGLLEYVRINTLLAAATDNLRESLTLEPDNWDARWNLEYAFRITPPPREKPKADFQGSKSSVFSTLPSLPGGGP